MLHEYDFLDRFSAAADAGFSGVEILFPYEFDADQMAALLELYQLELCLINLFLSAWDKGERGFGALLNKRQAFYHSVYLGVNYAGDTNAGAVHMMVGIAVLNDRNRKCHIDNVR